MNGWIFRDKCLGEWDNKGKDAEAHELFFYFDQSILSTAKGNGHAS
jgi:hypothetical protein